jgi:PKD repeat protein
MRITKFVSLLGMAALAAVAGCVKDVDQPALAGPSTFAHSIVMVADRDTLLQNGVDFTDIRITSLSPDGTSENVQLRAQIYVDGVANDFGTLSTKSPMTPATIRYTAPPASPATAAQVPTTVTIGVTLASSGDFRGETTRTVDINLQPVGIITPGNPNLTPAFTLTPAAPKVMDIVTFDATGTTNNGSACANNCTYAWDFGDGTAGTGQITTHQFRTIGNFSVSLTVSDLRGATAKLTKLIAVGAGTPPTVPDFIITPSPAPTNVDIFFDATAATPATGRQIVSYSWEFGDGAGGSGPIVSHKFAGPGTYSVTLTVTDDAGSKTKKTQTVPVGTSAAEPSADFSTSINARTVTVNANNSKPGTGATISNYRFDYGDGNFENVTTPIQSHTYTGPGTFVIVLEITDTNGKKASINKTVVIP